jgi:hypothetical protein
MLLIVLILGLVFLGISRVPRRYRLTLWTLVIALCVVPWWGFQWHSHWSRVSWWPFVTGPLRFRDVAVNLLLYMPFGLFFVQGQHRSGSRVAAAVATGLLLSLTTELTQVYSHGRFPSATDVVMNGIGVLAGAWMARPSGGHAPVIRRA